VVCQSNIRQIGIGILSYADDYQGYLPPSEFIRSRILASKMPQQMISAKLGAEQQSSMSTEVTWDGLGILYSSQYTTAAQVFYCPSHRGQHRFKSYADRWNGDEGEIVVNYHYRGEGPAGIDRWTGRPIASTRVLFEIDPKQTSLIADGMRVRDDFNHEVGSNFFRADLSVLWFSDPSRRLLASLPTDVNSATAASVTAAWTWFDSNTSFPAVVEESGPD
jgi:hypothetical protein